MFRTASPTAVGKHDDIPTYQHTNMQTYQHTGMQTCKPITMVIYIAGSIPLFRGKRSNHFRLQRQSKHGALCRLKGQAAAPFPDKSSSRFAASVFIGKTLYPTAPPPTTDRKGKIIRWGYTGKQTAGTAIAERQTGRRTARHRVFTEKIP